MGLEDFLDPGAEACLPWLERENYRIDFKLSALARRVLCGFMATELFGWHCQQWL